MLFYNSSEHVVDSKKTLFAFFNKRRWQRQHIRAIKQISQTLLSYSRATLPESLFNPLIESLVYVLKSNQYEDIIEILYHLNRQYTFLDTLVSNNSSLFLKVVEKQIDKNSINIQLLPILTAIVKLSTERYVRNEHVIIQKLLAVLPLQPAFLPLLVQIGSIREHRRAVVEITMSKGLCNSILIWATNKDIDLAVAVDAAKLLDNNHQTVDFIKSLTILCFEGKHYNFVQAIGAHLNNFIAQYEALRDINAFNSINEFDPAINLWLFNILVKILVTRAMYLKSYSMSTQEIKLIKLQLVNFSVNAQVHLTSLQRIFTSEYRKNCSFYMFRQFSCIDIFILSFLNA